MKKKLTAYEWGLQHQSCREALEWRKKLGPKKTQATAWRLCKRGDWMVWQLYRLLPGEFAPVRPAVQRAIGVIADRAVRMYCLHCGTPGIEAWAARWLDGTDRSAMSAWAAEGGAWVAARTAGAVWDAARIAAWAAEGAAPRVVWDAATVAEASAAGATELNLQARDIRREIPVWPGTA